MNLDYEIPAILKKTKMYSCYTLEKKVMHIACSVKLLTEGQSEHNLINCLSVSGDILARPVVISEWVPTYDRVHIHDDLIVLPYWIP